MVVIRERLPQEVAALLEKALEAAMDALKEERKSRTSAESCATPVVPANVGIPQPGIEVTPYQVMIHVDSAVFADASDDGVCELENGDGVSAETCQTTADHFPCNIPKQIGSS